MKLISLIFLVWVYIKSSNSLPIEELSGFTSWPINKRGIIPEDIFSNAKFGAKFGVEDDTCRGHLPGADGTCWTMQDVTKLLANRAEKTKECMVPCLFYTEHLSGAAERASNFVLRATLNTAATEGPRMYQTIWDLHDKKFYSNVNNWAETPELRCIYEDENEKDKIDKINGCRRLYFMAMSKAMAMECSGEVFLMTSSNLLDNEAVPENGIWWETEFPTLIDGNRPQDKKVTKITFIQVPKLTPEQFKALAPEQKSIPPQEMGRREYWPTGPGAKQLGGKKKAHWALSDLGGSPARSSPTSVIDADISNSSLVMDSGELEKRADSDDNQVLELGDAEYPFYYSIDDMVEWYGDMKW